jgi:vacuolar-type H+-ATPase subunit I/STV1
MIYPERMERVAIVGPKARLKAAIEVLHDLKVLHIVEHRKDQLDIGSPLPGSAQLSDQLVKVRSVMHTLNIQPQDEPPKHRLESDIAGHITRIVEIVARNQTEEKQLQDRLARLRSATGANVEKDREAALRAMEAVNAARERVRIEEQDFLYAAERFLTVESKKAQSPLRFAVSKSAFLTNQE